MVTGIAGSRGFIGSYLSRYLASKEFGRLRLLARNSANRQSHAGAEFLHGDLLSRADCERFADGLQSIYYLAHNNSPVDSDSDLPSDALANLVPLLNLIQTIQQLGTKPHIVYFSSGGAVYAPKHDQIPFREEDRCGPVSSYGIQKLAAEEYLRLASHKGYLTATVLRIGNAYGELLSQFRLQGLIGVAINCVLLGQPIRLFGDANNMRDYIHLQDICEIAARAIVPRRPFTVINVGSGVGHTVLDVLHLIEERLGQPVITQSDQNHGNWLTDWVVLDNTKAREEFGWSPMVDLRAGIDGIFRNWQHEAPRDNEFDPPIRR